MPEDLAVVRLDRQHDLLRLALLSLLGIAIALGRDVELTACQQRDAGQVKRGVVGQVFRLPDNFAGISPPADELEGSEIDLLLHISGQAPDVFTRGHDCEAEGIDRAGEILHGR